jgi:hypothetical protein
MSGLAAELSGARLWMKVATAICYYQRENKINKTFSDMLNRVANKRKKIRKIK